MKKLLIAFCVVGFLSCSDDNPKNPFPESHSAPTYEETKMTLRETENANPTQFLKVSGIYRQNLIDQWVIEGTIMNTASAATYKDVVLTFVYFSKTDTELGRIQKPIYEFLEPNKTEDFKFKTAGYDGTISVKIEIASATPVQ